jgi:hypothetical protein
MAQNIDELFAQMEADDLADQAEVSDLLTPVDYARLRDRRPQLVYYYIRTGRLDIERCNCGRKCINVNKADALFTSLDEKHARRAGGIPT